MKVQSIKELRAEMLSVVRGEAKAPPDAGEVVFESPASVFNLLTNDNLHLMSLIANQKPESVTQLAKLADRAESNVSRALKLLVDSGLVKLGPGQGKAKIPALAIREMTFNIKFETPQPSVKVSFA